ncbi:MAG: rhomboid family intramembrane serine protease [Kiritimatiellia bacterium]
MFRRLQWRLRGLLHFSTATTRIVAVAVCAHILLIIASRVEFVYGHSYALALRNCFSLQWPLLISGFFWQPVSYLFLHAGWWHLILNMWACVVFGSALERNFGSSFFYKTFFLGGICGAVGWLVYTATIPYLSFLVHLTAWLPATAASFLHSGAGLEGTLDSAICIGASGAVFALMGAYLAIYPRRELYVLLFLIIPLRLKARTLLWIILGITLFDWFFIQSPIANSAHLCGGILGYCLGKRVIQPV